MITTTAIMVDGGFYRKQANILFGEKSPKKGCFKDGRTFRIICRL